MIIKCRPNKIVRFSGFTLAEAMMAVVVLSIATAGVLLPFSSGAAVRAEGVHKTLGAKLANDLMEQIVNTPFDDIAAFYVEPQGQVKDSSGAVFTDPAYQNFSRSATCEVWPESGATPAFILVTVHVQYNGIEVANIKRLISE